MSLNAKATHSTKKADSASTMHHNLAGQRRVPLHTVRRCHNITPKPPMKAMTPKNWAKRMCESNLLLRLLRSLNMDASVQAHVPNAARIRIEAILLHL